VITDAIKQRVLIDSAKTFRRFVAKDHNVHTPFQASFHGFNGSESRMSLVRLKASPTALLFYKLKPASWMAVNHVELLELIDLVNRIQQLGTLVMTVELRSRLMSLPRQLHKHHCLQRPPG
jgi:hypothetical protein